MTKPPGETRNDPAPPPAAHGPTAQAPPETAAGERTTPPPDATLLRHAARWHMIGLLFQCPQNDWQHRVASVAAEIADPDLQAAARSATREASEGLYHSTFGPGGPVAIREVSYRQEIQPGPFLAELRELYRAFGFQPTVPEPPDHVAVEAEFVSYLFVKQAYAQMSGMHEEAALCARTAARFLEDHLATIAEPLATTLAHAGVPYLAATAQALDRHVRHHRTLA